MAPKTSKTVQAKSTGKSQAKTVKGGKTAAASKTSKNTKSASKSSKSSKSSKNADENVKVARSFKMIDLDGVTRGRYTGSGPKQAASKAFSKYLKHIKEENPKDARLRGGSMEIYIKESTRGGKKKIFAYTVKRTKLAEPHISEVPDGKGGIKEIPYKFRNDVKKLSPVPQELLDLSATKKAGKAVKGGSKKNAKATKPSKAAPKAAAKGSKTSTKSASKSASKTAKPVKKTSSKKASASA